MGSSMREIFGQLSREEVVRRRAELDMAMACWRGRMGDEVAIWPDDIRAEYADMSQTWLWLGLYEDELQESCKPPASGA